jgi:phage gpG-like protein
MAITMRIQERGSKEFRAKMRRLQPPKIGDVHTRALGRGGEQIQKTTRRVFLSGRSLQRRSGDLQRSIIVDRTALPRWAEVGSNLRYAPPHEFGWPGHNLPARPFLRPAAERDLEKLQGIYVEEIDRALDSRAGGRP